MRFHKCPGCRKVFGVLDAVVTADCDFCGHTSSISVDTDTPLPYSLQQLRDGLASASESMREDDVRHNPTTTARCAPLGWNGDKGWLATIKVLSRTHIGLLVHRRFECKTTLCIQIEDESGEPQQTLMAKVVSAQDVGHGQWVIGCVFCRQLEAEEMQAIV